MDPFPFQHSGANGLSAVELFRQHRGTSLGYADIILMPGYINFPTDDVDLSGQLTPRIRLKVPMVSSPMDTVTEAEMAIAMALNGGIGFVHCNQTIEEQAAQIRRVKRYRNGIIDEPVVVSPTATLETIWNLCERYDFSTFPVVQQDPMNFERYTLVGMVSKGDVELVENVAGKTVQDVMRKREDIVVAPEHTPMDEIHEMIRRHHVKQVPIVDEEDRLVGLVCRKDIRDSRLHPLASLDSEGKLLVGAAITTHTRDQPRARALIKAGVDVLLLDSAQGSSSYQLDMLQYIKQYHPETEVICGNVVTPAQAARLLMSGADSLRVGMGVGSICTTQTVCGVGRGQASAVYHVCAWVEKYSDRKVPIIADGGISGSGDIIKALSLGASTVMMGGVLAACDESPGEVVIQNGIKLKRYRGMGAKANKNSEAVRSRYGVTEKVFVPQGVEGRVVSSGSVHEKLPFLAQGVRQGLQDVGASSADRLRVMSFTGDLGMERRSAGAELEGNVHHLYSYEK